MTHKKQTLIFWLSGPLIVAFFSLNALIASAAVTSTPIHVDQDASGDATGLNWTDAYTNVQDALTAASSGDEIWIAEGVYYPDEGGGQTDNDQTATFQLIDGVSLYGGFVGGEGDRALADWRTNITVFSGDIDQNDPVDSSGLLTSSRSISGNNSTATIINVDTAVTGIHLQGVWVTAGTGSGLRSKSSTLTLADVAFWGNLGSNGGGLYSKSDTLTVLNAEFRGNEATGNGGGMHNRGSTTQVSNALYAGNKAGLGAGFYNHNGNATLSNVTVSRQLCYRS